MEKAFLVSYEVDKNRPLLRVAFDKAGAEHLIEKIRAAVKLGDHVHDNIGDGVGDLTARHIWGSNPHTKMLEIEYQFVGEEDQWEVAE